MRRRARSRRIFGPRLSSLLSLPGAIFEGNDARFGEPEVERYRDADDEDAHKFGGDPPMIFEHRTVQTPRDLVERRGQECRSAGGQRHQQEEAEGSQEYGDDGGEDLAGGHVSRFSPRSSTSPSTIRPASPPELQSGNSTCFWCSLGIVTSCSRRCSERRRR